MSYRFSLIIAGIFLALPLMSQAQNIGEIQQSTAEIDESITLSLRASGGTYEIERCKIYIDDNSPRTMRSDGSLYSYTTRFKSIGLHEVYVICEDENDGEYRSPLKRINVVDLIPPKVKVLRFDEVIQGEEKLIRGSASDNDALAGCNFLLNGGKISEMSLGSRSRPETTYNFPNAGQFEMAVECVDLYGNKTIGESKTVTVFTKENNILPGDLVKLTCPSTDDVNHPCKAVYYYGSDGKRHAFPNSRTYFSWYEDFDDIILVTEEVMSTIPLGRNVTYRAGTRLLKFSNVSTVYAISRGGIIHPISNETIAKEIFGTGYASQIDVLSDAFFFNYEIGEPVDSTRGFDQEKEKRAVRNFNSSLELRQ